MNRTSSRPRPSALARFLASTDGTRLRPTRAQERERRHELLGATGRGTGPLLG